MSGRSPGIVEFRRAAVRGLELTGMSKDTARKEWDHCIAPYLEMRVAVLSLIDGAKMNSLQSLCQWDSRRASTHQQDRAAYAEDDRRLDAVEFGTPEAATPQTPTPAQRSLQFIRDALRDNPKLLTLGMREAVGNVEQAVLRDAERNPARSVGTLSVEIKVDTAKLERQLQAITRALKELELAETE